MNNQELATIIEHEVDRSIGHWDGSLALERQKEIEYYLGKPFGNEIEGQSQVVSTDVADTIEGILPSLLRIFTSSDDAVRFDPVGPEDEDQAKQQTDVCNYVFYKENNGFLVMYEWFKDALIQKNGVVKYWWEPKTETTKEQYEGLTEGEYLRLKQQEDIEILDQKSYDDPQAVQQLESMKQNVLTQARQRGEAQQAQQVLKQMEAGIQIPKLYDCEVKLTRDVSKVCIQAIPPEEFGISAKHNCVSIQEAPFCYHRTRQTKSWLRENGCPEDIIERLSPANEPDISPEALARDRFLDNQWRDSNPSDDSNAEVWVTDGFIRIDYDGDGIAELRHFIMPGREVWINEEAEHINFAALTPVIMPHRWSGRSVSELVADIQFTKSVIWRQMLDNLYLTNNPQKAVLSTAGGLVQANLDDLLLSRPGGIFREYQPNAIRNIETPFVAGASFPMLEYMDGIKENRTGVTRYNQGTDANSLNKTARGINQIMNAGQQRIDLIARIFAETGVKDLFKGIVYTLSKYKTRAMTMKLRNKWVQIDPREWKNQLNLTINVGLGTGNRDEQIQHFQLLHQDMIALMQEGRGYMISDENLWNLYTKRAEAMGFKHPELFVTDPRTIDPRAKQPQPDPAIIKAQMDAQGEAQKLKFSQWKEQLNAETQRQIETLKAQALLQVANLDNQTKERIAQMQAHAQAQIAVFNGKKDLTFDFEKWKTEVDNATKIAVAQISAKSSLDTAALSAAEKTADELLAEGASTRLQTLSNVVADGLSGHLQQHAQALTGILGTAMDKMGGSVGEALNKMTALQAEMHKSHMVDKGKPSKVSIENVEIGKDGIVKGATIRKH